jgi:superfamily II DNA or RNA helicase
MGRLNNNSIAWIIDRPSDDVFLLLHDKYSEKDLDYRKYAGALRTAVREFSLLYEARQPQFHTDDWEQLAIINPPAALVQFAADAGALFDAEGSAVRKMNGVHRCAMRLDETNDDLRLNARYCLMDDADVVVTDDFMLVAPSLALGGGFLYDTEYLGNDAPGHEFHGATVVKKADLAVFLSLVLSRVPGLVVFYEGWSIEESRAVRAQPALVFTEIDEHDYLHVRPLNYLKTFPPAFLEDEGVVTAVELHESEKRIRVSEIVFADAPADMLREMMFKGKSKDAKANVYEENGFFMLEPAFAANFIGEKILELADRFVLLETQVLASYKVTIAKPRLRLSAKSGIDYLEGEADIEFANKRFSFAAFLDEYKRNACVTLFDGAKGIPDKKTMERLERLISRLKGEKVEASRFDLAFLTSDETVAVEGAAWDEAKQFFTNYHLIADLKPDLSIENGKLRPYQEEGVRWLCYLGQYNMGACLADEMGLGKTVQIISLLRNVYQNNRTGKVMILCTKSLVYNWASELEKFAPELPFVVHYGQKRDTVHLRQDEFSIVITSYITVQKDLAAFAGIEFLYLILDESQNIKNISTQTTMSVMRLKARNRIAISGTPIENNLMDLYSLFRFLLPGFFGSREEFTRSYLTPIQTHGIADALFDLKLRIAPFVMRRLKRNVLKDLPPKSEEIVYIDLDDDHIRYYHQRRIELRELFTGLMKKQSFSESTMVLFKALTTLRQVATVPESVGGLEKESAKRQYLLEKVVELCENGHKCIIFTNFLASVRLISTDLTARGIGNVVMTGETADRQALVNRFQTEDEVKAFVMTLKTGGAGLNLTAADYIFIMDPWWNGAAEAQAVDRAHRIGQLNPVFCYKLIARDTIEERILQLQQRKKELVESILSDDAGSMRKFTAEDIDYLLGDTDVE